MGIKENFAQALKELTGGASEQPQEKNDKSSVKASQVEDLRRMVESDAADISSEINGETGYEAVPAPLMPEKAAEMKEKLFSISNLDDVGRHVKEYEQDCFRVWRDEQKAAGTYEKNMAIIFSGFDYIKSDDKTIKPWTEANEKKIINWLEERP